MKTAMKRRKHAARRVTMEQKMKAMGLSETDKEEIRKFQSFFGKIPMAELVAKYGVEYL